MFGILIIVMMMILKKMFYIYIKKKLCKQYKWILKLKKYYSIVEVFLSREAVKHCFSRTCGARWVLPTKIHFILVIKRALNLALPSCCHGENTLDGEGKLYSLISAAARLFRCDLRKKEKPDSSHLLEIYLHGILVWFVYDYSILMTHVF